MSGAERAHEVARRLPAMQPAMQQLAQAMSEDELLQRVIAAAHQCDYLCHHTRPLRRGDGRWRTAVQGDTGFPDLVIAGHARLLLVEFKRQDAPRPLPPDQHAWATELRAVVNTLHWQTGRLQVLVWRPLDWLDGTVLRTLRDVAPGPAEPRVDRSADPPPRLSSSMVHMHLGPLP